MSKANIIGAGMVGGVESALSFWGRFFVRHGPPGVREGVPITRGGFCVHPHLHPCGRFAGTSSS